MVKQSLLNFKNTLDYKNLILTLLITIFVFATNLNINKHYKLLFIFLSLAVCIYDLKYLIPFVVSFLIVTSFNYRNLGNKEIKEHFFSDEQENKFITEMKKLPFFIKETDAKLKELFTTYKSPKDIYNALNLDNIDDNTERNITYFDKNKFSKKLSILFTLSPNPVYSNYMYKIVNELGFSQIYNGTYDSEENIDAIKYKLNEVILLLFEKHIKKYNLEKGKDEIDINTIVDSRYGDYSDKKNNHGVFNYNFNLDDYINDNYKEGDYKDSVLFNNIKSIIDFEFKKKLTNEFKKLSVNLNNTKKEGVLNPLEILNDYESVVKTVINRLNLFDKIRGDTIEKKRKELNLYKNIYTFIIFGNTDLHKIFKSINSTKFESINKKLQDTVDTHPDDNKFLKLTSKDIFYNSILFFLKIKEIGDDLYVEDLLDEYDYPEAPEESPPPAGEEYKTNPLWYNDSKLKKSFDVNEMNNKNEQELEKYYRAMDFNSPNLKEISKHAEDYNEKLKIENISFDKKIDDFSKSIFDIIDEFNELINEMLNKDGNGSPSPSPSYSGKLEGYDYYIYIIGRIIDILINTDRIIHMGFVIILLALFIYFIDSTSEPVVNQNGGFISLMDYLNKIKI